jgi:2-polyprenyl-3-methyl-5-hydroxy-6-metoxy-1,4-benzoquinol methylase
MVDSHTPELERLVTDTFTLTSVEHLHRYAMATTICGGKDVLDIACGEGYGSNLLTKNAKSVIGVDISNEAIESAKSKYPRPNLKFLCGTADAIPLEASSIDVVVSFETLEHHDKHEEMLSEITRVLRANGVLIISTPDKLFYSDIPNYKNAFHVKELYLEEFRSLIDRYFKAHQILFQGLAYGTLVAPAEGWGTFSFYGGNYQNSQPTQRLPHYEYLIAIASDGTLPEFGVSFFDGIQVLRDNKRQDWESLPRLERQLHSLENTVRDLRNSMSFRLGCLLTAPVRKLFGR